MQNFGTLQAAIKTWCNRTGDDQAFNSQVSNFISLAEQQIFIDCSTLGNQQGITRDMTIGQALYAKPQRWGRTLTMYILQDNDVTTNDVATVVERISLERGLLYSQGANKPGKPIYYTDAGFNGVNFFPTPDKKYRFLMIYYENIRPLSIHHPVNWNSTNNYDALFYLCLSKAYLYLHNNEDSAYYEQMYKTRLDAMLEYDRNRLIDRNSITSTFLTQPQPISQGN